MRTQSVSILLGLTATLAVSAPLPVQAASFNFDSLPNIKVRPISSQNQLNFFGSPDQNQGYTAFFNLDPNAPDQGHQEISLNSPGNIAPYYTTGRHTSIEDPASGSTRSASLEGMAGFSNLFNFLTTNGLSFDSIGFSYGQKPDRDFTKTWNMGDDVLGQDWFASADSTIEERIYQANPDDVEIFLTYGDTKIVNLGYTPFYSFFDYGATTSTQDDTEAVLSELVPVSKRTGLNDPIAEALADAFVQDVQQAGGGIQLVYQDEAVSDVGFTLGGGGNYGVVRLPFPFSLRAGAPVSVPEPSAILGLLMFGAFGVVSHRKKRNCSAKQ